MAIERRGVNATSGFHRRGFLYALEKQAAQIPGGAGAFRVEADAQKRKGKFAVLLSGRASTAKETANIGEIRCIALWKSFCSEGNSEHW